MHVEDNENQSLSADDLAMLGNQDTGASGDEAGNKPSADAEKKSGTEPTNATSEGEPVKPLDFSERWRDEIAAGLPADQRDKAKQYLKTRNSPYEVLRAGMSADAKISELMATRVKIPTGKDDDPKDVASYAKARGVPDKADDYKLDVPDGFELSETDQQLKGDFFKAAHQRHWNQADVDLAVKTHMAILQETEAEQAKQRIQASQAAQDELRVHFGKDYRASIELTNRMFQQEMSELGMDDTKARQEALSIPLADGRMLGELPWFVKMMAKIARERSDDGAFEMGESGDGVDLDAKIDKIMDKKFSDPKEYERLQPELQRLIGAQQRRERRAGKGA